MPSENHPMHLPEYDGFLENLAGVALPISASELHGIMCGYLCASADNQGESYLRALLNNKKDEQTRLAATAMFAVYSISQQQIANYDFEFQMLLPDDESPLVSRAEAFSDWCQGFILALTTLGIGEDQFYDEESQEALSHIVEFGELDCDTLDVDEEDEKALFEVCEYTRLAVLRLHGDLVANERERGGSEQTH